MASAPEIDTSDGTVETADLSERLDEVSRAFGDPTRRSIWFAARKAGSDGVTVAAVASSFGVHPNVARHHLERLLEDGYLAVAAPSQGTRRGAGRPSKRYVATAKEVAISAPHRDEHLLVELLLATLTNLDEDQASQLAEEAGAHYGRKLAASSLSPSERECSRQELLASVAAELNEHGFAATADVQHAEIVSHECPFGEIAQRFPHVVCALDHGMVRGMVDSRSGVPVELRRGGSRAQGDPECVTRF